jgi:hypothetical protein
MKRVMMLALATAALGLSASPALAAITLTGTGSATTATITSGTNVGDSFTINFDGEANGVVIPGLSSSVTLTFEGTSGNSYNFNYLVNNTSSTASRVTVFGFNTDPNITSASSTGVFPTISNGQLASFNLEVCLDSGNNSNCNSSTAGAGVASGTSGNGTLTLNFATLPGTLTLNNFLDRYQGVGTSGISAEGHPVGSVPEPATWAMMLLGFGGIGAAMRRRRKPVLAQLA